MNKFNLNLILADCYNIYRFGGEVSLQSDVFNFKSDGNGWWIAIKRKNKDTWHGISISPSKISLFGYSVEYSPMKIIRGHYNLIKENCNVSRMVFVSHFQQKSADYIALVQQIITRDAEYKSLVKWIEKISKGERK